MSHPTSFEAIFDDLRRNHIQDVSRTVDEDSNRTEGALQDALPELLEGLRRNTRSGQGAEDLTRALDRDHDGSILDDLRGHVQRGDYGDGEGILKHVLGDRRDAVVQKLATKNGISLQSAGKLLAMLAPVLLGMLGKARKGGMGSGDLAGMIQGGLGNKAGCLAALLPLVGKFLAKRR